MAMFRLGYNTNGLAHHRLDEALILLAKIGYEAVAITPDVGQLDPFRLRRGEVSSLRAIADDLGLAVTIETGARFLLDPKIKHGPNLMEASVQGRECRIDFYRRCIDLAGELGAPLVSLWSGADLSGIVYSEDGDCGAALERLAEGLEKVLNHAREKQILIGFEPEPGMFIEGPAGYQALLEVLGAQGDDLGLTLDVGHLVVTGDLPERDVIHAFAQRLVNVHLDDCRRGVHEHLPFGQGDLNLVDSLAALREVGFRGVAAVELSRDSHHGPEAAVAALQAIRAALVESGESQS